mgnify:CR=1 FL=1
MTIFQFILGFALLLAGFILGWLINSLFGSNSFRSAKEKADQMIQDAREESQNLKNEKIIEAEEEIYQLRQKLEEEFKVKGQSLKKLEADLNSKEYNIDRKADLISKKEREIFLQQREINNRENQLNIRQEKLDRLLDEENRRLETISGLTRDQAKKILMDNLMEAAKKDAASEALRIMEEAKSEAEMKAKNIIISAIQQNAITHAVETTVSIVNLPNDDMKGRIIGREGRNIRAFEITTGIDVIVDDTPEAVILSGYDPYRRELARITMEKLVSDGRIHPGRIEETYEKTKKEMDEYFAELGEQAILETGIHSIHPDLSKALGKLRYRNTFGQNVLHHSKEVAMIAGLMAAELGLDEGLTKRAGLLHDIGKAVDRHVEGNHAQIGYEFVKKYGEHPVVLNAILAHHGDVEVISPISILVQIANEISKSRPGARREVIENFVKRMRDIEEIALSFQGVKGAYALQAGKEVRVIIDHEKMDDSMSFQLANDIAKKVQTSVEYPGQIKIVVIREFRSVDYA